MAPELAGPHERLPLPGLWWLARRQLPGPQAAAGATVKHLVVYCAGELVHDPHPSGDGIKGEPIDQWVLVPLDPGKWVRR